MSPAAAGTGRRRDATYYDGDLRRDLLDARCGDVGHHAGAARRNHRPGPVAGSGHRLHALRADPPRHFEVMWRADLLDDADPALAAAGDATFSQLTAAVAAAQAEGWAADADTRTAAYLAWSVIHGQAVLWINGPLRQEEPRPFEEVAGAVADLLARGLAPGQAGGAGR